MPGIISQAGSGRRYARRSVKSLGSDSIKVGLFKADDCSGISFLSDYLSQYL